MRKDPLAQKMLCLLLAVNFFFVGCGGHMANPVDRYMLGDEKKSCDALWAEMSEMDNQIALKRRSITNRDIGNVICFVTGFLVIVPWFFIDSKGSHEVELEALIARKNALKIIWSDKGCSPPGAEVIKK